MIASIPAQLNADLEALYREFERYRPQGSLVHSPLKPHSVVAPLESKPLRELTADDGCRRSRTLTQEQLAAVDVG
ncbi:MAG: hypothetical protein ACM3ZE_01045 [Myxococcales bacterium]